jgi:hypothetical protein
MSESLDSGYVQCTATREQCHSSYRSALNFEALQQVQFKTGGGARMVVCVSMHGVHGDPPPSPAGS